MLTQRFVSICSTNLMLQKKYLLAVICCIFICSCKHHNPSSNIEKAQSEEEVFDLDNIEEAGELIAVTISGPESYFQYHNVDMGLQYMLAEKYANEMGLRLRVETVRDTTELISMLNSNKADLIAYTLPSSLLKRYGLVGAGMRDEKDQCSWSVRKKSPLLAESLNKWYKPNMPSQTRKEMQALITGPKIRHSCSVFSLSQGNNKNALSPYDAIFYRHSHSIGWDWKLLAAQCFQESAFDPQAVSWAGARGLMQIMPATGAEFGVSTASLFHPETNIATAAKYIKLLDRKFSDIRNPLERIKFILAAYNGGYNHIRDAMSLARKYHRSPYLWNHVGFYVLHLSDSKFYKDPVVKSGYMIGSETYNYVNQVLSRWNNFRLGKKCAPVSKPSSVDITSTIPSKSHKKNRFSGNPAKVLSKNDSIFQLR